jgi:hypothetical protein
MSSLTGLSKRQVQVLWAVDQLQRSGVRASGPRLQYAFQNSALVGAEEQPSKQGLHQTAASLVHRSVLERIQKERPGHSPEICYLATEHGRALLAREVDVHGRPL